MKEIAEWIVDFMQIDSDWAMCVYEILLLLMIFFVATVCGIIMRRLVLPLVKRVVRKTHIKWDDYIFSDGVLKAVGQLVPAIIIYSSTSLLFDFTDSIFHSLLWRVLNVYLIVVVIKLICALIESIDVITSQHSTLKDRPLHGVYQMFKLIAISVGVIIIISNIIGKSPLTLITGIGAAATVLMLIFKDSIVGFVAGIQLSANDMLRPGDWICVPKSGVDGEVIDVTMTTVKVRNWDKTITTIPPYTLVSDSFQNWRGMTESGGRRMKRSMRIDFNSIRQCTQDEVDKLISEGLLHKDDLDTENVNVVLYTRSIERYMHSHAMINRNMTMMVRQLEPGSEGLPIEFYCFCADINWVPYEHFQTSFMGHAIAILPKFGMRVYQRRTNDFEI